jgi:hypothetical protein
MDNFDLKKYLVENKLTADSRLAEGRLFEASIEQLQIQFVDSGKINQEDFDQIKNAAGGKGAYATWMTKKIADKVLKSEDIYKWKDYFQIFNRRKKEFKSPDINTYKTQADINQFIKKAVEFKDQEKEDPTKKKGISKTDKFSDLKIGEVDGFDVYEIPKGRKDLYNTSCELGSGTEWCTATGKTSNYFNQYIDEGPLYIFMKPGSDEKYQFHFESGQFMDKDDQSIM